jgi:DNA-binding protein HU-beta
MTKTEIVAKVAEEAKVTKVAADKVFLTIIDCIKESLKKGEKVTFVGFGTFSVSERKARKGRNPQTGKEIKIAAKKMPKFSAGVALKAAVNGDKSKAKKGPVKKAVKKPAAAQKKK